MKLIIDISAAVTEPHRPIDTYPSIEVIQDMNALRKVERDVFRYTGLSDDPFQAYNDDLYQRALEGE
jgi:hypothetical protein